MIVFLVFLAIIVLCVFIRYHWGRRHLYVTAFNTNGPMSLPIIGSTFLFICKTEDLLERIYNMIERNDNVFHFWLGPQLIMIFKEPQYLEKIMCSKRFSHKHDIYDLIKGFLGEGLITSSGPKHKLDKKMIQPFFNLQFSSNCIKVFERHIQICIEKLDRFVDKDYFDIGEMIHLCVADIIGDCVLGYEFNSQDGRNLEYVEAFTEVYKIGFERLVKPWLHPDVIFNHTKLGKRHEKICHLSERLMKKASEESHRRKKLPRKNEADVTPIIDNIAEYLESNSDSMDTKDYFSHLITLYMASQDTIALIVSAACLCFGMYPEYQKKVINEIHNEFGRMPQHLLVENIGKLRYLDMCVKDIFRLFPIAPYILRKTLEEVQIDKWFLAKNCGILIPIYNLHKNPKYWENPDHFHPDHFLPKAEKSRPQFSYMPFSAGPRGCIGKVFANVSVKVIVIKLLQYFEIEALGKIPDVKFTTDISVRSLNGYKVKIKRRSN